MFILMDILLSTFIQGRWEFEAHSFSSNHKSQFCHIRQQDNFLQANYVSSDIFWFIVLCIMDLLWDAAENVKRWKAVFDFFCFYIIKYYFLFVISLYIGWHIRFLYNMWDYKLDSFFLYRNFLINVSNAPPRDKFI